MVTRCCSQGRRHVWHIYHGAPPAWSRGAGLYLYLQMGFVEMVNAQVQAGGGQLSGHLQVRPSEALLGWLFPSAAARC